MPQIRPYLGVVRVFQGFFFQGGNSLSRCRLIAVGMPSGLLLRGRERGGAVGTVANPANKTGNEGGENRQV